jgi:hypothetical protein
MSSPAGWYPQPDGQLRYWDGELWTEHFAPGNGLAPEVAPTADPVADEPTPEALDSVRHHKERKVVKTPSQRSMEAERCTRSVSPQTSRSVTSRCSSRGTNFLDRKHMKIRNALLALVVGTLVLGLSGCGSAGYNDPDTLAHSVLVKYNAKSAYAKASSANCVNSAPHAFVCQITDHERAISVGVVVSEDGNSWVTTP